MGNPVVHFEIAGSDGERLGDFYGELFGWQVTPVENGGGYRTVQTGGESINGGIGSFPNVPAYVTFYVQVDDLEGALARAEELGGKAVMAPREVRLGLRAALFADPDGNMVGIISAVPGSES